jgi:NDP-sugar pyrophosphorylase family protein
MVLAAGLGTRLRPLTDGRPKALVEVAGRTLLEITLSRLRQFGIREVIINVHHFADMVAEYLKANNNFGMRIELSREDDLLLDTGGGLKKAAWFFLEDSSNKEEPFILHNVDIVSNIDFSRMLEFHNQLHPLATLAVQHRETSRYLLFNNDLELRGRRIGRGRDEMADNSSRCDALAFTGIHVISPRLLRLMKEEGAFSIIECYLRLVREGERILAFRADEYYWRDLGRIEDLHKAAEDLKGKAVLQ